MVNFGFNPEIWWHKNIESTNVHLNLISNQLSILFSQIIVYQIDNCNWGFYERKRKENTCNYLFFPSIYKLLLVCVFLP